MFISIALHAQSMSMGMSMSMSSEHPLHGEECEVDYMVVGVSLSDQERVETEPGRSELSMSRAEMRLAETEG